MVTFRIDLSKDGDGVLTLKKSRSRKATFEPAALVTSCACLTTATLELEMQLRDAKAKAERDMEILLREHR